jgi:hypothetical protein
MKRKAKKGKPAQEAIKIVVSVAGGCVQAVYGQRGLKFDVTIDDEDEHKERGLNITQRAKINRALTKGLSPVVRWGLCLPAVKTLLFKNESNTILADEQVRCLCGAAAKQVGGSSDGYEDWTCRKCGEMFQVDREPGS